MGDETESNYQRVLRLIWDTRKPAQLLPLLAAERSARSTALADDLRQQAQAIEPYNSPASQRLIQMEAAVREMLLMTTELPSIPIAPGDALAWMRRHSWSWYEGSERLLLATALDVRRANPEQRERLVGLLCTVRDVNMLMTAVVAAANGDLDESYRLATTHKRISFAHVMDWLQQRARVGGPSAVHAARLREALQTFQIAHSLRVEPSEKEGYSTIKGPTTAEFAEFWFYCDPIRPAVEQLRADGTLTPATLGDACTRCTSEITDAPTRLLSQAAFCEIVVRDGPSTLAESALQRYLQIQSDPAFASLPVAYSQTHRYRFAYAVSRVWSYTSKPTEWLSVAIGTAQVALSTVDRDRHPRILRDLQITIGRLAENLSWWIPAQLQLALQSYEAVLSDTRLDWERDIRAGVLSDYAHVLMRLGRSGEAEAAFEEALELTRGAGPSLTGVLVCMNYAIYLMDLVDDARSKTLAAELLEEAIAGHAELDAEEKTHPTGRSRLASVLLTRANLRRNSASTAKDLEAVLGEYDLALQAIDLDDPQYNAVAAQILINKFYVYLDLARARGDQRVLLSAEMAIRDAKYRKDDPTWAAEISVCEALLDLAAGNDPSAAILQIEAAQKVLAKSGDNVRSHAALKIFLDLRIGGPSETLPATLRLIDSALEAARRTGLLWKAVSHARQYAQAAVRQSLETFDGGVLVEAVERLRNVQVDLLERLNADLLLVDGARVHAAIAGVSTDLVWLQSVLEVAPEELIPDVILAKGVDAALDVLYEARASGQPELRDYLDSLRKADWAFRSKTLSTSSVSYNDFEELSWRGEQRAIAVGKTRRGLILDGIRSATNAIKPTEHVVVDLTVTNWGTIVLAVGDRIGGFKTRLVPFALVDARRLLARWDNTYDEYGHSRVSENEVQELLDAILGVLGQALSPFLEQLLEDKPLLLLVPHILDGVPLHALPVGDQRLLDRTSGIAYAAHILGAHSGIGGDVPAKRALCVAFDPGPDGDELVMAVPEVAAVSAAMADAGAAVSVLAVSGTHVGEDAIRHRGATPDPRLNYVAPQDVVAWFVSEVRHYDRVHISGHAIALEEGGALKLVSGGKESLLGIVELLARVTIKPGASIHVSACESTMPPGRVYALVDGLIRIGAGRAVGADWVIRDKDGFLFAISFQTALRDTSNWARAWRIAIEAVRVSVGDAKTFLWSPFRLVLGSAA